VIELGLWKNYSEIVSYLLTFLGGWITLHARCGRFATAHGSQFKSDQPELSKCEPIEILARDNDEAVSCCNIAERAGPR